MNRHKSFEPKWLIVAVFFAAGTFLGGLALLTYLVKNGYGPGVKKIHPPSSTYRFINPLLAVDSPKGSDFFEHKALETKIDNIFKNKEKDSTINKYSLYFRDLEAGRWVGINEDLKFPIGTFLKVPLMVTYYRQAEVSPGFLEETLVYKRPANAKNNLEDNKQYSIDELIKAMLNFDDDSIAELLFNNIDKNSLNEVYSDLGVSFYEDKDSEDFITPKLYSLFFRVLHNATYLNREDSEKALEILSQTNTKIGIASGLPSDVLVAHKYRVRLRKDGDNATTYVYDCGIAYYPDYPYTLCIMVAGSNTNSINNMLREISKVVYADIESRHQQ